MKNIKNVVSSGCSFVFGSCMWPGGDPRENSGEHLFKHRFTSVFSNEIGAKDINLAIGGGSNDRALRKIYEWIQNNKESVKDTFFIVGFTDLTRKDLYLDTFGKRVTWMKMYRRLKHSLPLSLGEGDVKEHIMAVIDKMFTYNEVEYKYFYNQKIEHEKLMRESELLQSYIESMGGNITFFGALYRPIELDSRLNWYMPGGYDCWPTFLESYYDYRLEHPTADDHEKLGKDLVKYYESNK